MSVPAEKTTTLAALRQPATAETQLPSVQMGFGSLQSFELMQRAAKLLAASTLVPKDYQNNLPNCVIALNMATRLGADPLLVMQNLYVVHGRPGWSAQFLIATFNQCGRFAAIRYKWSGTEGKDDWSCQAYAMERETNEVITGPLISIALAKKEGWYQKSGSKWQSIPQLMLMYRAAAWLVRTHAPEISMGLLTESELHDVYDAKRGAMGEFSVELDDLRPMATATGTAIDAGTQSTGDAIPHYDEAAALKALKEAGDLKALTEAWNSIIEDFDATKREIPPSVDEAYKDCKAKLAKL